MVVPEQVTVALNEIAADAQEGLLALAVGAGLQVMQALFTENVAQLCGAKGKHDPERVGYRHGTEAGWLTLGGRRVPVQRPRVRAADGSGGSGPLAPGAALSTPTSRSRTRRRFRRENADDDEETLPTIPNFMCHDGSCPR